MNYEGMPNKPIMCIDMKCFYASCVAMLHGLDILKIPIAVVANFDHPGSIVLAVSPLMREKFKIKTSSRRWEIPKHPDIRLFEPKMSFFIQMSMTITKLISNYVPVEAIHVYSVDESFVDLTGTEKLWGSPEETAKEIQRAILDQFNVPSAVGMGPNMLIAKLALDLDAKRTGFAQWTYEDIPKKLWPVRPLSEMWGIGKRMEANLNAMGIQTVGGLANADLAELEKRFGIIGNQLYYHAWGIDLSKLGEPLITNGALSFGKGQMLMRDYHTRKEISVVLLELSEEVARRARHAKKAGRTVNLGIGYSKDEGGGGFSKSRSIDFATNITKKIYTTCLDLFKENYRGQTVRNIYVSLTNLASDATVQLDIFEDVSKQRELGYVMDSIRNRFGSTAILRARSYTEGGIMKDRSGKIGGHKK
ncbi:Y-family DNA polymerase [Paenibacillus taichungensis]